MSLLSFYAFVTTVLLGSLLLIIRSLFLFYLLTILLWFALPGVLLARQMYRREPSKWTAALLAGPACGYVLSSLVLLALWIAGVRNFFWLMTAPIPAVLIAWPAGSLAPSLSVPRFTHRDVAAVLLSVLVVPAVLARPYARVGTDLPDGRAYRAYFTADFVWEMAVVSEVSKGDVPPRNPYYLNDDLHYYWLMHLLPAVEHRAARNVRIEHLLLVNAFTIGLAFVGFFYFFVRHFVDEPWAAAAAVVGVIFCSSFEGADRLIAIWREGGSLDALRYLNIDAVGNWIYHGMKVDGLHRLLLYQPQHQLGYVLGFTALLVLVEASDVGRPALLFLVGAFLGMSMLLSSFAAGILAAVAAVYETVRLAADRRWRAFIPCAMAAAVPLAAAVALGAWLRYVDTKSSGNPLVVFGVNRLATHGVAWSIFLNFGPVLIVAGIGIAAAIWRRTLQRFLAPLIVIAVSAFFYFLVDVPDHQGVYVAWRASHLAFVALAPLCAYALQTAWESGGVVRTVVVATAVVVAAAALPTVVIDLYNTQDVANRAQGPGFRWTVILAPDEVKALDWIKQSTPKDARVQVEPDVRGRDTWAYVPAFAERRMAYGMPIGMIPLAKYEKATAEVKQLYQSASADEIYARALGMCIDYLVVGAPERAAYPKLQPTLDAAPQLFAPTFRNSELSVYAVSGSWNREGCRH
jgi:hypothetical protein